MIQFFLHRHTHEIIIINNYSVRLSNVDVCTKRTLKKCFYEAKQIFKFPVIHWFLDRPNAFHFIFFFVSPLCLPVTVVPLRNWSSIFLHIIETVSVLNCVFSFLFRDNAPAHGTAHTTIFFLLFFRLNLFIYYYYYTFYIESLKCVKIFSHRFN